MVVKYVDINIIGLCQQAYACTPVRCGSFETRVSAFMSNVPPVSSHGALTRLFAAWV